MDFSGTFDTTNALACMFLWIIFGYLSIMLNCDIQRFLKNHKFIFHFFGLLSFFFLFTLLDTNNKSSITVIWIKTIFVYALFVMMTKSKWYFVLPVLTLLLIDQMIKKQLSFLNTSGKDVKELEIMQKRLTNIINNLIIIIIVIGTIHYAFLQYGEYGAKFSWKKLFLANTKCKK